jgi:hypothetical protein
VKAARAAIKRGDTGGERAGIAGIERMNGMDADAFVAEDEVANAEDEGGGAGGGHGGGVSSFEFLVSSF